MDHTADLGVEVIAEDLKKLFEKAGATLTDLIITGDLLPESIVTELKISGIDLEDLMVRWLGEILYLFQSDGIITVSPKVHNITSTEINAEIESTVFNPKIHFIKHDIKAVTYHQIRVENLKKHWKTRVIFDL